MSSQSQNNDQETDDTAEQTTGQPIQQLPTLPIADDAVIDTANVQAELDVIRNSMLSFQETITQSLTAHLTSIQDSISNVSNRVLQIETGASGPNSPQQTEVKFLPSEPNRHVVEPLLISRTTPFDKMINFRGLSSDDPVPHDVHPPPEHLEGYRFKRHDPSSNSHRGNNDFKYKDIFTDRDAYEHAREEVMNNFTELTDKTQLPKLRPDQALQSILKNTKLPKITTNIYTFPPWLGKIRTILMGSYMSCLSEMPAHLVPNTEEQWAAIDDSLTSFKSKMTTLHSLTEGVPPRPNSFPEQEHLHKLNGMFLGVLTYCPSLLETLLSTIIDSLGDDLLYLVSSRTVSPTNFRMIYFGVINVFILSTDRAKTSRFMNYQRNFTFNRYQSPAAFAALLKKEQKEVNILYGSEVITDTTVKDTFITLIERAALDLYGGIMDQCRYSPTLGMNNLTTLKELMEEKFLDRKVGRGNFKPLAYSATTEPSTDFTQLSGDTQVDKSYTVESGTALNADERKRAPRPLNERPCFQFRDKGKCEFGNKCKYSHDKIICDTVNLTVSDLVEQVNAVMNHLTKYKRSARKTAKRFNGLKQKFKKNNFKSKSSDFANSATSRQVSFEDLKSGKVPYEDAVKLDPSKIQKAPSANVVETEPSDGDYISYDSISYTSDDDSSN